MTEEFIHKPVLLEECLAYLRIKPEGVYVDGTLGGAGHSVEVLKRLNHKGTLVGLDQDREAIEAAEKRLSAAGSSAVCQIRKTNFCEMVPVCRSLGLHCADGILLDLGVSSHQLDQAERGFSYRFDAPLDMRMDRECSKTAYDVVNEYSEEELCRIIRNYGEERFASRVARKIAESRRQTPVVTTGQLVEIIKSAIPPAGRQGEGHPAKRTFQAIRIEVNGELDVLKKTLQDAIAFLAPGGRLCVISFHSLEDRIVKTAMREAENPCECPPSFPVCVCGRTPLGQVVTRKPVTPTLREQEENPRAKSAKLRVFEKRKDERA